MKDIYFTFHPKEDPKIKTARDRNKITDPDYEESQKLCKEHHYMKNDNTETSRKNDFYLNCEKIQCKENEDLNNHLFIKRNDDAVYRSDTDDGAPWLYNFASTVKKLGKAKKEDMEARAETDDDFKCIEALQNVKHEARYKNPWDKNILCAASLKWEGEGEEKKLVWKCPESNSLQVDTQSNKSLFYNKLDAFLIKKFHNQRVSQ